VRHVLRTDPAGALPFTDSHPYPPAVSFDGGELDCGNGLLLLIRKHIDPLDAGQLLEILSMESSVEEDLPAWCRLTGNQLVSMTRHGAQRSFLVSKGTFQAPTSGEPTGVGPLEAAPAVVIGKGGKRQAPITQPVVAPTVPAALPPPVPAPPLAPLAICSQPWTSEH